MLGWQRLFGGGREIVHSHYSDACLELQLSLWQSGPKQVLGETRRLVLSR